MNDRRFYVYAYVRSTRSANGDIGSPYYIGKGAAKRAYDSGRALKVPRNRTHIIIAATDLTESEAFMREEILIGWYGRIDIGTGCLRNLTNGGEGSSGCTPSAETRRKIGIAASQRYADPAYRQMMSVKLKGRKLPPRSEETCRKISALRKQQCADPEYRRKMSAARTGINNRPISEELRLLRREANKLRRSAPEYRQRQREAHLGRTVSAETRERMRQAAYRRSANPEYSRKLSEANRRRHARNREKRDAEQS